MRRARVLLIVCALALAFASAASADWAGADPASNYVPGDLSCTGSSTGASCIDSGVYWLDEARASLGQPPYKLPADFASLSPAEQLFVLVDLDRVLYGLAPITGLTAALDDDALARGVEAGGDPTPSDTTDLGGWTSNWAGGYENVPLAYLGWMYDDGLGSPNLDCTAGDMAGCWGHRHDILWEFDPSNVLAMGAAVGDGPGGFVGYAMLLTGSLSDATPAYTYTWSQAVADGAGTNDYDPGSAGGVGSSGGTPHCVVPKLVGKKLARARRLITAARCRVGKVTKRYSRYRAGLVSAQKPRAGTRRAAGAKVQIVVSKGRRR